MIKINLVPAEILAKAEQRQQMLQAAAGTVCLALLLGLISWVHWRTLTTLETQLASDNERLKQLKVIVEKVKAKDAEKKTVKDHLDAIQKLHKGRLVYPTFMADFVRSVPSGVRVRSMGTAGGGSGAVPLKLTITAEAHSNKDIREWVQSLETSGRFSGVELGAVTTSQGADRLLSFTMTSVYTPAL